MTTTETDLTTECRRVEAICRANYEQSEPLLARVKAALSRLDAEVRAGWAAQGIDLTGWEHGVRVGIYAVGSGPDCHRPALAVVASLDFAGTQFAGAVTDGEIDAELKPFFAYFR